MSDSGRQIGDRPEKQYKLPSELQSLGLTTVKPQDVSDEFLDTVCDEIGHYGWDCINRKELIVIAVRQTIKQHPEWYSQLILEELTRHDQELGLY